MRIIPISAVANQSFSVQLEGNRWDITLKAARSTMIADIKLNDEQILSGSRIVAGTPIIPYRFLQGSGNFILLTDSEDIPAWQRFGIDQQLIYGTFDELSSIPAETFTWPALPAYAWRQIAINSLLIILGDPSGN